jgi:hypothetical protein
MNMSIWLWLWTYGMLVGIQGSVSLCAHCIFTLVGRGGSLTCVDWSSYSTEPHAHCILIFWRALSYDILVMAYLRNLPIRTLSHNCIYIHHSCITSCVYIERYLLTELLNSPSYYLSFQAYSLLAGHFCWTFRTCSFVEINIFSLCLVSAPQL